MHGALQHGTLAINRIDGGIKTIVDCFGNLPYATLSNQYMRQ